MKAILGRLSDLGLKELFRLLDTVGAAGSLEVASSAGNASLLVSQGRIAGEPSPALVKALIARSGTFCFRPSELEEDGEWESAEEFVAKLEEAAAEMSATEAGDELGSLPAAGVDPLAELRSSLAEVTLPEVAIRVVVFAADPRPYRTLEPLWREQGWETVIFSEPSWPEDLSASLVVLHLPSSGTLAGQGDLWLSLVQRAAVEEPPVPVIWAGGLADPWLRHQSIVHGAEFLLPSPAGDTGEAARWFREEVSLVAERLLDRREAGGVGEAVAFRELFVALHAEASPADARASILRFASSYFDTGFLLAVRDSHFEVLGAYGFSSSPARLARGQPVLEEVVLGRRVLRVSEMTPEEGAALASLLGLPGDLHDGEVYPLLSSGEVVALFLGDGRCHEERDAARLGALLARSGSLLSL